MSSIIRSPIDLVAGCLSHISYLPTDTVYPSGIVYCLTDFDVMTVH